MTIDVVARVAGVSPATVSRVVNANANVSPETRAAVVRAVEHLGYVPNRAARSLMTRRSDSIGVVVLEPASRLFGDPFFGQLMLGISEGLAAREMQLVLLMAPTTAEEARVASYLPAGHVDGAILIGPHGYDTLPDRLVRAGVPLVVSGRPLGDGAVSYVDSDNLSGARRAVVHLCEGGRRKIATIHGTLDMASARDRLDGYREALASTGLDDGRALEIAGDYSPPIAAAAMARLLERQPDLDAVFAASDSMAVAALRVIQDSGRRVPDDVALVGFDDTPLALTTKPTLTTVRQPITAMGAEMTRLLLEQIDRPESAPRKVVFPTELVVRESSRAGDHAQP